MSSFKHLGIFRYNNPEAESQRSYAQAALNYKTERQHSLPALKSFGLLPQGYCEQKNPNS